MAVAAIAKARRAEGRERSRSRGGARAWTDSHQRLSSRRLPGGPELADGWTVQRCQAARRGSREGRAANRRPPLRETEKRAREERGGAGHRAAQDAGCGRRPRAAAVWPSRPAPRRWAERWCGGAWSRHHTTYMRAARATNDGKAAPLCMCVDHGAMRRAVGARCFFGARCWLCSRGGEAHRPVLGRSARVQPLEGAGCWPWRDLE